jgi:membrane protein
MQTSSQGSILQTFLEWLDSRPPNRPIPLTWLHRSLRILAITLQESWKNDLSLRAAALTFTILLALVPMLAMSTAVLKGLGGDNHLKQAAYGYVATLEREAVAAQNEETPSSSTTDASLAGHLRSAIDIIFDYVDRTNFTTLGTLGILGLFLSILLVLNNIEEAMNVIWHVPAGRSLPRKISDYLTLLVLMPLSINIGFAASAFLKNPTLFAKLEDLIPLLWLQTLILKLVPVIFIALTLYVIYLFFPNTRVRSLPAMAGALLAAVLWFAIQNVYITLQIGVSRYNAIYGSFATLPLFLMWIYFIWLFILIGAQFAYACQNLQNLRLVPAPSAPTRKLAAAFAVMADIHKGFEQETAPTLARLEEIHPEFDRHLIRETVRQLSAAGLLHVSSSTAQILPAAPAENITPARLIGIILQNETTTKPEDTPASRTDA